MKWTTEVPTEDGYYWYDWHYSKPQIIYFTDGEVLVDDTWIDVRAAAAGYLGQPARFAGPIPEPEEMPIIKVGDLTAYPHSDPEGGIEILYRDEDVYKTVWIDDKGTVLYTKKPKGAPAVTADCDKLMEGG